MPGQERLKYGLTKKFKHLLHSLRPSRNRSTSPNRPIRPSTPNSQVSSAPVGPDPTSSHGIPDAQPPNSPPLPNIYPSIVIDPAGDEAPGRMAFLASAGFQGLKTTLQLVESVSGVFPPLKSAVAGLLGVIDIMEVRDFQHSVVMVLTVPRQPLRTNKITKIWSGN
jgi:hypothetical protein